ncbi:MAG: S8 family serine peptidase, partial [Lentimicrobiaceae bacterium]|nr:S8 family serine peptidase [Lentimicrobiaceae bacterium]
MKKALITSVLSILFTFLLQAQQNSENFYYYYGKKLFIQPKNNQLLLKFDPTANKEQLKTIIKSDNSLALTSHLNIDDHTFCFAVLEAKNRNDISLATLEFYASREEVISANFLFQYNNVLCGIMDEFIVKLKPTTSLGQLQLLAEKNHCKILKENDFVKNQFLLSISKISSLNVLQISNLFYETGLFEFSEPNFFILNAFQSNDPYFDQQWSLKNVGQNGGVSGVDINIEPAWEITQGSHNIKIALPDDGVDLNHPDLYQSLLPGYDASSNNSSGGIFWDSDKHGTACCGILCAKKDNNKGISGVAPDCKTIPIHMSANGGGFPSIWVADAVNWAWKNGADVMSNSWGGLPNTPIKNAIDSATIYGRNGKGCVVVCAAGNSLLGITGVLNPACQENVLAVGAIDRCGFRAGDISWVPYTCDPCTHGSLFSSYGEGLNVVAPGSHIYTTDVQGNGGYNTLSGTDGDYWSGFGATSSACPQVAGIAALILSIRPDLMQSEVRQIIESTCKKLENYTFSKNEILNFYGIWNINLNGTWNKEVGHGLVDAHAALTKAIHKSECRDYLLPAVLGTITQNTIWNTPMQVVGNIAIPNGVSLTISSTVKCDYDVSFIIHSGGKLIIDGGKLTNACGGEMWEGITVIGDPNLSPSSNYQTTVQIKNGGAIENAVCGITVTNGGHVSASKAHFINNKIGVKFEPRAAEQAQTASSGSFSHTNFVLNNNYLGNLADFEAHIIAQSSGSVGVTGCVFSSTAPKNISIANRNNGIVAINTNLSVSAFCTNMHIITGCVEPMDKTSFTGFTNAIKASNSGASPALKVSNCNFYGNLKGILLNGINYPELILNYFAIPEYGSLKLTHGIHISDASGYKIEENNFWGAVHPFESSVSRMIGIHIQNSGANENEVYKNSFSNLAVGQLSYKNNASAASVVPPTGLQILCNSFDKMHNIDILVGSYPGTLPIIDLHTIRKLQGSTVKPTGNLFMGTTYNHHIDNFQSPNMLTYYYGNQPNEYPLMTRNIYTELTPTSNSCPSKIRKVTIKSLGDMERALSQYNEWNEEYEYWLEKLLALGGDSGEEYNTIL